MKFNLAQIFTRFIIFANIENSTVVNIKLIKSSQIYLIEPLFINIYIIFILFCNIFYLFLINLIHF